MRESKPKMSEWKPTGRVTAIIPALWPWVSPDRDRGPQHRLRAVAVGTEHLPQSLGHSAPRAARTPRRSGDAAGAQEPSWFSPRAPGARGQIRCYTPTGTLAEEVIAMMDGFWMGCVWIWPVLLVAGIAALVWGLRRAGNGGAPRGPSGQERAYDILRERFARGEITEQEYRERVRVLDEH